MVPLARLRRPGLAAVVAVAALLLGMAATLFSGVAHADPPAPGTAACTTLVNSNPAVQSAQSTLTTAKNKLATDQNSGTASTATLNADQQAVDQAQNLVNLAVSNTTALLCTGTPATGGTGSTGSTGGSGSTPTATVTATPAPVETSRPFCSDFPTREAAQAFLDAHPARGARLDADGDGKACEDSADGSGKVVTGGTSTATGTATATRETTVAPLTLGNSSGGSSSGSATGSTGTTSSGGQVSVVPNTTNGVDTGGWDW